MKTCKTCWTPKSFDEFYVVNGKHTSYCRDCGKKKQIAQYRKKNPLAKSYVIYSVEGKRHCSMCKQFVELEHFKTRRDTGKHLSTCNPCRRAYAREYYKKRGEEAMKARWAAMYLSEGVSA